MNGVAPDLPKSIADRAAHMKAAHESKGWKVYLWHNELWEKYKDDEFVKAYRKQYVKEAKTIAFICDYFRLLLLRDHGGVFTDVDSILVKGTSNTSNNITIFTATH